MFVMMEGSIVKKYVGDPPRTHSPRKAKNIEQASTK